MDNKVKIGLTAGPVSTEFYRAVKKVAYEKDTSIAMLIKTLLKEELKRNGIEVSYRYRKPLDFNGF